MYFELVEEVQLELKLLRRQVEVVKRYFNAEKTPSEGEITMFAGFLHAFYNGVENIFQRIAKRIDGKVPSTSSWHQSLLSSMASQTRRGGPVISEQLEVRLKDYLFFRHKFRHAYTSELRWIAMVHLVINIEAVFLQFESEIQRYLHTLTGTNGE